MNNLIEGSEVEETNILKMTSILKSRATKKINQTVRRIIQLPSRYSHGLKAPKTMGKKCAKKKRLPVVAYYNKQVFFSENNIYIQG